MRVIIFIISLLTLHAITAGEKDRIYWNADRILTFDDFKGKPSGSKKRAAMTSSGVSFDINYEGGETIEFKVAAYFTPDKSWFRPDQKTGYILKHEQGHFNLTEIYARKLRKSLKEKSFKGSSSKVRNDISNIYQKHMDMLHDKQQEYDRKTEHSIDKGQQEKWNEWIKEELAEYDEYVDLYIECPAELR